MQGLKALQVEESAKEIRKQIGELGRHLGAYQTYMDKLGNTLGTTINHYNAANKEYKKIDKDVYKITDGATGGGVEVELLERPTISD